MDFWQRMQYFSKEFFISIIVSSNVGSGLNVAASKLLLIQSLSIFSSKDAISWYVHGNGVDTFQMIVFDLINSIFKWWFRSDFFWFKAVFHNNQIKILVKGCSNFSSTEFWWNTEWYFIDNFSSFWEAWCFWVESKQFFFNLFWFWIFLFYEIKSIILLFL